MYFIYNPTEHLWLLGHCPGECGVPTCIWGTRWQDALAFEHKATAQKLAARIGRCEIVHTAPKPAQSAVSGSAVLASKGCAPAGRASAGVATAIGGV